MSDRDPMTEVICQVAYGLRIRPLYCLDHQVEHETLADLRR